MLSQNLENQGCQYKNPPTCNDGDYQVGWSTLQTLAQPAATPDKAVALAIGPVTQTSMELRWQTPEENESPLIESASPRVALDATALPTLPLSMLPLSPPSSPHPSRPTLRSPPSAPHPPSSAVSPDGTHQATQPLLIAT